MLCVRRREVVGVKTTARFEEMRTILCLYAPIQRINRTTGTVSYCKTFFFFFFKSFSVAKEKKKARACSSCLTSSSHVSYGGCVYLLVPPFFFDWPVVEREDVPCLVVEMLSYSHQTVPS